MLHRKIVQANDASTLSQAQLSVLPRMRQSLTKAVTYYLTHEYDQYRFNTPPPPPVQGDSVASYSGARSSPARQSVTNADTSYPLHYDQVRFIMPPPPFEGGGGNHYTSCYYYFVCHPTMSLSKHFVHNYENLSRNTHNHETPLRPSTNCNTHKEQKKQKISFMCLHTCIHECQGVRPLSHEVKG